MNLGQLISHFVRSIRTLNVPRIEDLPYWTSPPIQFVYESTAALNLGSYTWNDGPTALTPQRPLLPNAVYYFRHVTLTADVSEFDFSANISTTPAFRVYLKSTGSAMLFREPILMSAFLRNWDYRLTWQTYQSRDSEGITQDRILGGFIGALSQGPGLIGKTSITLKAIISAQEIVDTHFCNLFKAQFPAPFSESESQRMLHSKE